MGEGIGVVDWIFLIALVAIWAMLLYHIILVFAGYMYHLDYLKIGEHDTPYAKEDYPMVSILVPAHNEAVVIDKTVNSLLRLNYPSDRYEVIIIDDSSTDGTTEVLDKKKEGYKGDVRFEVLHIKPPIGAKGKSNALMHGLELSTGEMIVIYDADNTPERDALRYLVEPVIKDKKVGAVVGRFRTRNKDKNLLTNFINIETISFQWMIQAGRSKMFNLATISGTNFLVRRSVLDEIGGWLVGALTEDTEMSIRIYEHGYTIKWYPYAVTWEQEPDTFRVWTKQRVRWCRGNLWVVFHYLGHFYQLRNPRIFIDLVYFFFTYIFFFIFIMLSDLIFVFGSLKLVHMSLNGPFSVIWFLAYALFIIETFITLNMERGEAKTKNLLIVALMYFSYCQLWLYIVWMTIYQIVAGMFRKKPVQWDKTARSREG